MELFFWVFFGLLAVACLFGVWGWWDYQQTIKKLEEEDAWARHNAALAKASGEVKKKRPYTRKPKNLAPVLTQEVLTQEELSMMQAQQQNKANGAWMEGTGLAHPNHPNGAAYGQINKDQS